MIGITDKLNLHKCKLVNKANYVWVCSMYFQTDPNSNYI